LLRHSWALGAAVALPILAPHSVTHLPSIPVFAGIDGGVVQTSATIERRPILLMQSRPAVTVVAAAGQTLDQIAAAEHGDAATIRWANALAGGVQPAAGSAVLVPPGPGALVPVRAGELVSHFAARLNIDPRLVLDYNQLGEDLPRPAGTFLQVPAAAAPPGALLAHQVIPLAPGIPEVDPAQYQTGGGSSAGSRFPWGQCTWYLSTRRLVPWNGNGGAWYRNAQAFGRPEGRTPVAGAIAVYSNWGPGHVAYVERVNPDGSFLVSEMNFPVLGGRDERTLTVSSVPGFEGFIY